MTQFFTTSDGTRLAYRDEGEGLPLLCLSGLTRSMSDFDYLAPHLRGHCRLIRMDYRGRGESQWTGAQSYTVEREAEDALELLDLLGVEKAAVIGTSRGGMVAMYLASVAKDRLLGVLLNDVGPVLDKGGLERIFLYLGRNPVWKTYEQAAEALPQVMTGFANVPPLRWMQELRNQYQLTEKGLRFTYDPALRDSFLNAFQNDLPDIWPFFAAMTDLPLALLRGANSDLLSQETALRMQAMHPDMLYAEVPDRAHIPYLDEPESLAVIEAFMARCAALMPCPS